MSNDYVIVNHQALGDLVQRIFAQAGVPEEEAATAADVLVRADLRGIESHGIARLERYYVSRRAGGSSPPG